MARDVLPGWTRLGVCLLLALAAAACDTTPGATCVGGLVQADGTCVARCDPSRCLAGNVCVDNACALSCTSHLDCVAGEQSCTAKTEDGSGARVTVCVAHEPAGAGLACPLGSECADALVCVGSGGGDGEAYCSTEDCHADADCLPGFTCGVVRDPRAICGTDKGNGGRCGTTTLPCVEASALGAGGPLVEGPDCILHRTCVRRDDCAACAEDLDCSLVDGQRCVDVGGEKRCLAACAGDGDCASDRTCAAGVCQPRFGKCTGQGGFCEPCRDDLDCAVAGASATSACVEVYPGERACLDMRLPDACTTSDDCPTAPGGAHGFCLDETQGLDPSQPNYHHCYLPYVAEQSAFHCWKVSP
jgi:hypothetical protein